MSVYSPGKIELNNVFPVGEAMTGKGIQIWAIREFHN